MYRGDASAYLLRSSSSRVKYHQAVIAPLNNEENFQRGDIIVVNDKYERYKGELQIALCSFTNDGRRNVVGRITDSDLPLLAYLQPWQSFKLVEQK